MTFKVVIYAAAGLDHQMKRAESFKRGVARHGINATISTHTSSPTPCDLAVFWGMHRSKQIRDLQTKNGNDFLVMERGYVGDRFYWTSIGYGGLNGRADFCNKDSLGIRWESTFSQHMKEWNPVGEYILLTAQVVGDASLAHLNGNPNYNQIVSELRKHTKRTIYFRPHPQRPVPCPSGAVMCPHKDLNVALENAHTVVTINSNSSVDSVLAGKPCITLDIGSMAYAVTKHDFSDIENQYMPDRIQWAYDLAYTQWSPEEIENGDAWEHLKQKYM